MTSTPASHPPTPPEPTTTPVGEPTTDGPGWYAAEPPAVGRVSGDRRPDAAAEPGSGWRSPQGRFAQPVPRRRLGGVAGGALGLGILLGGVGVGSYTLGSSGSSGAAATVQTAAVSGAADTATTTTVTALAATLSPSIVDIHATGTTAQSAFGSGLSPYTGSDSSSSARPPRRASTPQRSAPRPRSPVTAAAPAGSVWGTN